MTIFQILILKYSNLKLETTWEEYIYIFIYIYEIPFLKVLFGI